jgi:hypothetical protein
MNNVGDTGCFIIEDGQPKIIHPLTHEILDHEKMKAAPPLLKSSPAHCRTISKR